MIVHRGKARDVLWKSDAFDWPYVMHYRKFGVRGLSVKYTILKIGIFPYGEIGEGRVMSPVW